MGTPNSFTLSWRNPLAKRKKLLTKTQKLLSRAFDKAARLGAGQASNLTEEEDEILLKAIRAYDLRKQQAFQDFWALLQKQGSAISYPQAKLMFKEYWREEVFSKGG